MPELPEVEIVKRGLAPAFENAKFADVLLNRADLRFPFDIQFAERLRGERVVTLYRRAKYIIVETESGLALAMHLGMTGRFTIMPEAGTRAFTPGEFYYDYDADPRHDHVIFTMSGGHTVRYNDVRRFGFMTLFAANTMTTHPLFMHLGVEPLSDDLTPEYLAGKARGKTKPLKTFLLDQQVVAGLGNIYVCEALFRARLPPEAQAQGLAKGKVGKAATQRLTASIKAVLEGALLAGGSSLRDYRHADGAAGTFQDRFDVYGRAGADCSNACGSTIERLVQQGRSTFYCPRCQSKV